MTDTSGDPPDAAGAFLRPDQTHSVKYPILGIVLDAGVEYNRCVVRLSIAPLACVDLEIFLTRKGAFIMQFVRAPSLRCCTPFSQFD